VPCFQESASQPFVGDRIDIGRCELEVDNGSYGEYTCHNNGRQYAAQYCGNDGRTENYSFHLRLFPYVCVRIAAIQQLASVFFERIAFYENGFLC
jgi:hypothetical protein